jgi:hypothetical protein
MNTETVIAICAAVAAIFYLYGFYHGLKLPQLTEAEYREMTADWEDLS